jgi:two-component system response regulator YesN
MPALSADGRVLIVDDEENVRFLLQRSLARLDPGLKVQTAESSVQALELLKGESFDLVITDFQMPYMNGLELCEAIRREYPKVKVVLMTAYPSTQVAGRARDLALDGYLIKPFSARHLCGAVHSLLIS